MKFRGKTLLVTGAGQGIGRGVVKALLAAGAEVVATDRNYIETNTLDDLKGAKLQKLDVTNATDVNAVFESMTQLDGLFNCAGIVHTGNIEEAQDQDWSLAYEVNVLGAARCIKAALPRLLQNGGGSIVNMASVVSSVVGAPNRCVYGATKAAVIGLTKSVAKDYVTQHLRCNAVCPGTVRTPSLEERLHETGDYDAALAAFTQRQPMGRIAEVEDITPLVLYLLSDDSRFLTGQAIALDGGWSM